MKIIIFITLVIVLIGSLTGVGILYYQNIDKNKRISGLSSDLSQSKTELSQINAKLSQANSALSTATSDLAQKDKNINSLTSSLNTVTQKYQSASSKVNEATCRNTISTDQIKSISTNQSLTDPITKVMEAEYSTQFISTSFVLIWNNSKTAIFTLQNTKKETDKTVVTWDINSGRLNGIYDIGEGCYYYLP